MSEDYETGLGKIARSEVSGKANRVDCAETSGETVAGACLRSPARPPCRHRLLQAIAVLDRLQREGCGCDETSAQCLLEIGDQVVGVLNAD